MTDICTPDIFKILFPSGDIPFVRACIDLIEPQIQINDSSVDDIFRFLPGSDHVIPFTYNIGDPPAHAFGVFFFRDIIDAVQLKNPIIENQPVAILDPTTPALSADPHEEQHGNLRVVMPMVTETTEYYGALVIYQNEMEDL